MRILMGVFVSVLLASAAEASLVFDASTLPGHITGTVGQTQTGSIKDGVTPVGTWSITLTESDGFLGIVGNSGGAIGPQLEPDPGNHIQFTVSFGSTYSGVAIDYNGVPYGGYFTPDDRQTYTLSGGAVWNVISNASTVQITGEGTSTITLMTTTNMHNTFEIAPSGPISGYTEEFTNLGYNPNGTTSYVDFSNATAVPEPSSAVLLAVGFVAFGGFMWRGRRDRAGQSQRNCESGPGGRRP